METRVTKQAERCTACNWYIYKEQVTPCRVTVEEKDGVRVEQVEFYYGEYCYNHPEAHHHHLGPVS